ncbi:MAG: universal stress protein [Nocardioides sp.]|nr:universal stress protein [Nocardioides sp.]
MSTNAFIAVGYDGSPDARAALSWVAEVATLRKEAIVVTIVVDGKDNPRGVGWPESWWADIEDSARDILGDFPRVEYRLARVAGNKVEMLSEAARDASMLVVGSHGHSVVGQVFIGSVSQAVARHAASPVVVVREPQTPYAGRIVVGSDAGEPSTRALEFACTMAEVTGDKVAVIRAWQPATVPQDRYGYAPLTTGSLEVHQARLEVTVEQLAAAHPTVAIQGDVVETSPARALVDASASASLVVVGSHGRNAVAEVMLGSVSHAVLHRAHCPVAVVE